MKPRVTKSSVPETLWDCGFQLLPLGPGQGLRGKGIDSALRSELGSLSPQ